MNKESHSSISCKHRTKRKLQSPKRHQSPDLHILQCKPTTYCWDHQFEKLWGACCNQLHHQVEVGCLRHPGATTTGSQLLDGDCSHGQQILATQPPSHEPHTGKGSRHLSHWINNGKREGRDGENCQGDDLPLQTTLKVHAKSTCNKGPDEEHMEF